MISGKARTEAFSFIQSVSSCVMKAFEAIGEGGIVLFVKPI